MNADSLQLGPPTEAKVAYTGYFWRETVAETNTHRGTSLIRNGSEKKEAFLRQKLA